MFTFEKYKTLSRRSAVLRMNRVLSLAVAVALAAGATASTRAAEPSPYGTVASWSLAPVAYWSLEAQRAIVPPPAGVGNKFPGEAAVYMGIVHAAIYDAAVAIEGGFRPNAIALTAPVGTSRAAAIAAAAHGVLVGLLPEQQKDLDMRYADYLDGLLDDTAKMNGILLGEQVATAVLELRANDGRDATPQYIQPPPGPGVFQPDPTRPVLGLRLSRIRPLALANPWQLRPDGPNLLTSSDYAADFDQVESWAAWTARDQADQQTTDALFWTDHDLRQWNEGMLRLAADQGLDFVQTARMLAMAHVSGGNAMIACFDAKFHYMFWRPSFAIPLADTDGNAARTDPTWVRCAPRRTFRSTLRRTHATAARWPWRWLDSSDRQSQFLARQPGHWYGARVQALFRCRQRRQPSAGSGRVPLPQLR